MIDFEKQKAVSDVYRENHGRVFKTVAKEQSSRIPIGSWEYPIGLAVRDRAYPNGCPILEDK